MINHHVAGALCTRSFALAAAGLVSVTVLSGCAGAQSISLPGGTNVGSDGRTYQLELADVTDLVAQSVVKEDGVAVGKVTKLSVPHDGWNAVVTIKVKGDVRLSQGVRAAVEQTSLLGEKYIALSEPPNAAELAPQSVDVPIPMSRTRTAAGTEDVLGALSALYNGGGLNQLEPLVRELNNTLQGNTAKTRSLLNNAQAVISGLDAQRGDIIGAINGLDALTARTAKQTTQIDRVLKQLPAGVEVLAQERPQFVQMLDKLDQLGDVGSSVLGQSHDALITDLKSLGASLPALAHSGDSLVTAFPVIDLFPFPDDLLPAVHGDSTSIYTTIDFRELNALEALGVGQGDPKYMAKANNYAPVDPANPWVGTNKTKWSLPALWDWTGSTPAITLNGLGKDSTSASRTSQIRPVAKPDQPILAGPVAIMQGGYK